MLFLLFMLLAITGCEDEVDPTIGLDVPFSMFGYLDPTADQQAIRVVEIATEIGSDPDAIDATVTSTDVGTGETIAWRDSLVTFSDGSRGHVFVADFTPRPGTAIEVEARKSDGTASRVTVTIPSLTQPTVGVPSFVDGGIGYSVELAGAPRVLEGTFEIVVGGYPGDLPGATRRIEIPVRAQPREVTPGVWSVDIPFVSATRATLESLGVLEAGLGLVALEYSIFVAGDAWDLPSGDPDVLVEPGVFSNVEGGLGFVGSGYATTVRWMAGLDAAAAAGFEVGDDPVSALVLNEIVAGENGWVEFYNPTLGPISLRGYTLTNTPSEPRLQRIPNATVVPPGGFATVDLEFAVDDAQGTLEVGVFGRTGELVLHVRPLTLFADEGAGVASYGSYPDGLSSVVRLTVGLDERIYDVFRGPLRPTRGAPNELGLEVAYINEIYTEGTDGWVETVTVMPGIDSVSVIRRGDIPGALRTAASEVIPSGVGTLGVAAEQDPGLILNQTGGTVYALAFFRDPRIVPILGPGKPPRPVNPLLDVTTQIRAVDAREYGIQLPGRSSGYLPSAPDGVWSTDLRPTRGTANASARTAQ